MLDSAEMPDGQELPGQTPRIAIIGSGFAGICLAIQLKKAGIESFTIFEKGARLGGTWRDNVYPGCACDVPSFLYCFSFEPKHDWSRKWAPQAEILDYLEKCADKYELVPHIRFSTGVESARFDAAAGLWRVRTTRGEEVVAEVLVSGVGQLNRPHVPQIPGLEEFAGESFHSARWNQDYVLDGKDVAVVGNAASAVQFVPEIAPRVRNLYVLQRSANWMLPKQDGPYTERDQETFHLFPFLAVLYRWLIWFFLEIRFTLFRKNRLARWIATRIASEHLADQVSAPELRKALTPDYRIGAKRILISDDYYPALQRNNVRLLTDGIDRVTRDGIVVTSGDLLRVDAVIFATGFESTSFLAPMTLYGKNGTSLSEAWKDGAEAYLGITVSGFPNFFMLYGPNTNLGHNSIIFMLECQVRYIVQIIEHMVRRRLKAVEVRPEVMATYNRWMRAELDETVWAEVGKSWYKTASGRITNNWSRTTTSYWWRTRRVDFMAYALEPRARTEETAVEVAAE